ncbi:Histone-lysine N-methyltransferase SETMAR [Araneus ventricosus]|uniref:Histone-lysine N-methyltransferase SETMAR n=1 Tax=Araneus ventricosus TaxID=182803 RepID=A0A4Y1ZQY5_ARAVE|nr:Histone-lysine N-methyltransferase SETMAR [Araneus ventricosus]
MVTVWYSSAGLIHLSFLNSGKTIAAYKYYKEIEEVIRKLQHMRPGLVNRKGPIPLHSNARPLVAQMKLQRLNKLGCKILPHSPYSPDLSPTEYHFFKHIYHFMKETIFSNQRAVEKAFREFIDSRTLKFQVNGICINSFLVGKNTLVQMVVISIKSFSSDLRYIR